MKYFLLFCSFLIINFTGISANLIVEHKNIKDVLRYVDNTEKILFAFDLDNTIWASSYKYVWSDYWYSHHYLKYADTNNQLMRWYKDLYSIRFNLKLQLCELETASILKQLQKNKNCWVIGLTKRWICLIPSTLQIIKDFDIAFATGKNSISENDIFFSNTIYPACYTNGIVFAGQNNKSTVLANFLEAIDVAPNRIILVDDSKKNLEDLSRFAEIKNIPYIGIWYSKYSVNEDQFDGLRADQEFEALEQNLSYDSCLDNMHPEIQQIYTKEVAFFQGLK